MFVRAAALEVDEAQKKAIGSHGSGGHHATKDGPQVPGDSAGEPRRVELLDRATNRLVPTDHSGSTGRLHRAWDRGHLQVEETPAFTPGAHRGSGAEDSGHNLEDQT